MTFTFDRGPHAGKRPSEVPDAYLTETQRRLRDVPEGHDLRGVLDAIVEEMTERGLEIAAPSPATPPEAFRIPPPMTPAQIDRQVRERKAALAAKAAGRTEPATRPVERAAAPAALMPCGHPTSDLALVEGSWRGVCRGCGRLERAIMRLGLEKPEAVLLDFEAEIRGYKPEEDA